MANSWAQIQEHKIAYWEQYYDTELRHTAILHDEIWKKHKPDGILCNKKEGKIRGALKAHYKYAELLKNITEKTNKSFAKGRNSVFLCAPTQGH